MGENVGGRDCEEEFCKWKVRREKQKSTAVPALAG